MQSYPPEFTGHHVPLMFVAGLGAAPSTETSVVPPPVQNGEPSASVAVTSTAPITPTDPFDGLLQGLRKALVSRKSWHVWDNSRGVNNDFHVIAVDKVSFMGSQQGNKAHRADSWSVLHRASGSHL
jgi:hypothetical protein